MAYEVTRLNCCTVAHLRKLSINGLARKFLRSLIEGEVISEAHKNASERKPSPEYMKATKNNPRSAPSIAVGLVGGVARANLDLVAQYIV